MAAEDRERDQSETDAMGLDKRREVIGGRYSPSLVRQVTLYGIFVVVFAALAIGLWVLAKDLDKPPSNYPDKAPWSRADAKQIPPRPIDFLDPGKPARELD